jgi:hypothetical protein
MKKIYINQQMKSFLDSVTIYLPDKKKRLSPKGVEHFNEFLAEYGLKLLKVI